MKVIFDCDYGAGVEESYFDECLFDNLAAPILRDGGEPFKSCYSIEDGYYVCNLLDPSRSITQATLLLLEFKHDGETSWKNCDCLFRLVTDFGIALSNPSKDERIAFWTIFPDGTADYLARSYLKRAGFLNVDKTAVRILNNPFFYADRSVSRKRIVEIAEDAGVTFALDRAKILPAPEILAKEIAMLNYGMGHPNLVEAKTEALAKTIAEAMDDWGLTQQTKIDED